LCYCVYTNIAITVDFKALEITVAFGI